ncbi:erythromycin esterase family protein [Mycolicibacterium holsaticum]|uniref:erythromycin esterase family protein n=1 Tax=Mycolicibacterium holsaticum TaxID=152142 RepID=UPI001C7E1789|nr:erythromycin esterase family protein [Mycolicibacterium holsaticum]MDA4109581.1 erythromycin esterase [Mycolicibacterium holsaticum DSM 44478 = JCM 12374]QZA15312.1 erythromycin esterase family protein [Mycolicibacterium holsaticum DSM 44478 = JCM 12374]UNC12417.1 erythromycin esterase family protein [Mycolicibacterium holsaticum DSM 44478 = JCM 12374]
MTRATEPQRSAPGRVFRNRREAGQILAELLGAYRGRKDVVVLGLARGGVPVAWEVAAALGAPLDAFIVRKLGAPGHEEFAMGALASGGRVVVNDDVLRALRITPQQLRDVAEREGRELIRRESAYRGGRAPMDVIGKAVILVDDGLATGASMFAAVQALRDADAKEIVIAVPAAPESTCRQFAGMVDSVVCATMPTPFRAVGEWYWDFRQVDDQEVRDLLATSTTGPAVSETAPPVSVTAAIRSAAVDAPAGMPPTEALEEIIGDARVVLIGESSHGTDEFYAARAQITKWLIEEKGFCAVAAEADWPDAYRVNRYVRGLGDDTSAEEALRGFERFPAWMWRNVVVRDFVDWLHAHNQRRRSDAGRQTGFYGLDLYSLHRSMQEVIGYLDQVDPRAAARARDRYACFDHTSADDGQAYGFAAAFGAGLSCERQAVDQLVEMQRNAFDYARRDGLLAEDEVFYAQQNAQTVRNAEAYYRAMFSGRVTSWNLRDQHMAQTLQALLAHLDRHEEQEPARIVVWAHNSHVGDARATEVAGDGQLTLGQLAREQYGGDSRLIGFTTYAGTVTAASEWGGIAERKVVRRALNGSVEELFHETGTPEFLVSAMISRSAAEPLDVVRLGRAIGVIYLPETERQSHYYHVRPSEQFDAIIHIDNTRALEPLEVSSLWVAGETPETYPTGL